MKGYEVYTEIRQLVERGADAFSRRDSVAYLDTWSDDAQLHAMGVTYRGRDEILMAAGEVWGQTPHAFLIIMSGVIHRHTNTRVIASWYGMEMRRLADSVQMIHRFDDTYEMAPGAGGWRILIREVKTLYQGEYMVSS